MDIEKLIACLSKEAYGSDVEELLLEAATALSTLQGENSQLRESRDHWKRLAHELIEGVNGKDAEHERLQAENEKLKDQLYDGEGVNLVNYWMQQAKIEENGHRNCQAENEKLRAELEQIPSCIYYKQGGLCRYGGDDPANVCVLGPCDHDVSVQDVLTELEQVKAERDAIEQDFRDFTKQWWEEDSGFPCRWCKFERQGGCEWKVKHPGEICAGRDFEWFGQKEN